MLVDSKVKECISYILHMHYPTRNVEDSQNLRLICWEMDDTYTNA